MWNRAQTLEALAEQAPRLVAIRKRDLQWGDCVLLSTKNSLYRITALGDDHYAVSGGWFDRQGVSPQIIGINGCTWGGSAIQQDVVAAHGLFLEFSNRVTTTRIQRVRVIRAKAQASPN